VTDVADVSVSVAVSVAVVVVVPVVVGLIKPATTTITLCQFVPMKCKTSQPQAVGSRNSYQLLPLPLSSLPPFHTCFINAKLQAMSTVD